MIEDIVVHLIVSTAILAAAVAAAAWVRPLTARTRCAILVVGLAALLLPAPILARLLEQQQVIIPFTLVEPLSVTRPAMFDTVPPAASLVPSVLLIVWASVAAFLLLRWWIVTRRLASTVVAAGSAPPARAVRALDDVRRLLGLHRSVDLIVSPVCEAPAVIRVFRPLILLPADGCDALDDEELRSLLCHECAHVARHDNLLGIAEAVICSLYWFNPLVWLAHRRIAAAREAACDERVADAELHPGTYVGALAKICRSLLIPRIPAVSCMANAHLKERIEHIMSYESLRSSALSHRRIAATAMLMVFFAVAGAGVITAGPASVADAGDDNQRYRLNYSVTRVPDNQVLIRTRVVDTRTGKVVGSPSVTTNIGKTATMRFGQEDGGDWLIEVAPSTGGAEVTMTVTRNGIVEQITRASFATPTAETQPTFSGQPLDLNLSNADIRDVLRTFARITGSTIEVADDVQAVVNVNVTDTPWDQAFDEMVRDAGFAYRIEGGAIHVYKP